MSDIEPQAERPTLGPTVVTSGAQFARLLRTARTAAGLSAAELAAQIGCSAASVSMRETGRRALTVDSALDTLSPLGYTLMVVRDRRRPGE